jgi:hypothetical protein
MSFIVMQIGGYRVAVANRLVSDITVSPTNASAQFALTSSGDVQTQTVLAGTTDVGDWVSPKQGFSNYECMMTTVSGSLTSGTAGSWLGLGTTRTWVRNQTSVGVSDYVGTLQIRRVGDTQILTTATIELEAEKGT